MRTFLSAAGPGAGPVATRTRRARRPLRAVALVVAVAGALALSGVPAGATAAPRAAVAGFDQQMIALLNQARAQNGAGPLAEAVGLDRVAMTWSSRMNSGGTGYQLQHDPNAFTEVAQQGAANRTTWGENVAWSSSPSTSADAIFQAYMHSPGHRANILNPAYHFVGMGTAAGAHGLWNTTEFTDKVQAGQTGLRGGTSTPTTGHQALVNLVSAWYRSVLFKGPDGGAAGRVVQLAHGENTSLAALSLIRSTEGRIHEVAGYYATFLQRSADPGGRNAQIAAENGAGNNAEHVMISLLGSTEAYVRAGGTPAAYASYVGAVALGRAPTAAERASWTSMLARPGGRARVAATAITSFAGRAHRVDGYYLTYLHRAADAAGETHYAGVLGSSGGDDLVRAFVLGSTEYRQLHDAA